MMHIEVLVEDSSGKVLLDDLVPKIIGPMGEPHTWRIISYKGIGRIPKNLAGKPDPRKRILLDRLPKILQGYGRSPGIDAVVVVVDADERKCKTFLGELNSMARRCDPCPPTLFRLAIEEIEAWYLGDRQALLGAYPRAKKLILDSYQQDSVCGTWEVLADAVFPGGLVEIKKQGWPAAGRLKHELAEKISPRLDLKRNLSPSFGKLREGLGHLVSSAAGS